MSSKRAICTTTALLCIAVATIVSAADTNVCILPASALYFSRTASPTPAPGSTPARNATPTPTPSISTRTLCWSQSAGVTIDAACLTACSCRRVESELTPTRTSRTIGVCINSSAAFACTGSGVSDCAAYVLNADGSSTLKAQTGTNSTKSPAPTPTTAAPGVTTSNTPQPRPSSKSSNETTSVPIAIKNDTDDEKKGLAAWAWALIVAGIVFAIALTVFTVNWLKYQPRYTKDGGVSDAHEHTDSVRDSWRDGGLYIPQPDPSTSAAAAGAGRAAEPTPIAVSGVAGQGYDSYRLGSTPGHVHRVHGSAAYGVRRSVDIDIDSDDGSSSIELHSPTPVYSVPTDGRRSSLQVPPPPHGGRADRAANNSQLSYATSDGSYGSGMDASFSSQLTLTELEMRDSDFTQLGSSCPRKKSTEF